MVSFVYNIRRKSNADRRMSCRRSRSLHESSERETAENSRWDEEDAAGGEVKMEEKWKTEELEDEGGVKAEATKQELDDLKEEEKPVKTEGDPPDVKPSENW